MPHPLRQGGLIDRCVPAVGIGWQLLCLIGGAQPLGLRTAKRRAVACVLGRQRGWAVGTDLGCVLFGGSPPAALARAHPPLPPIPPTALRQTKKMVIPAALRVIRLRPNRKVCHLVTPLPLSLALVLLPPLVRALEAWIVLARHRAFPCWWYQAGQCCIRRKTCLFISPCRVRHR